MSAGSFTRNLQVSEKGLNTRFFVSSMGRFAQPDGVVQDLYYPQALNRFSYVANNPLNLIDPTGNSWSCTGYVRCREWVKDALTHLRRSGDTGRQIVEVFEEYIKSVDVIFTFLSGGRECGCHAFAKGNASISWECFDPDDDPPTSAWVLAVMAHELIHLLDNVSGGSVYSEVDAYYAQYHVLEDLGLEPEDYPSLEWMVEFAAYIDERGGLENLTDEDLEHLRMKIDDYCQTCEYDEDPLRSEGEYSISVRYPGPKSAVPTYSPAKQKEYEWL